MADGRPVEERLRDGHHAVQARPLALPDEHELVAHHQEVAALERRPGRELDEVGADGLEPGVVPVDRRDDAALGDAGRTRGVAEHDVVADDGREVAGEDEVGERVRRDGERRLAGEREPVEVRGVERLQLALVGFVVPLRQRRDEALDEVEPGILHLERFAEEPAELDDGIGAADDLLEQPAHHGVLVAGLFEEQDVIEEELVLVLRGDERHLLAGRVDDDLAERRRFGHDAEGLGGRCGRGSERVGHGR